MNTLLSKTIILLVWAVGSLTPGRSESFSEPPVVIYGKVIQVSEGSNFQLFNGDLTLTISNEVEADHVITKTIPLNPVGAGDVYSYRVEVPVKYLPGHQERADNLIVGHQSTSYRFVSFTINGVPAEPVDDSLAHLPLEFSDRALVHRLDLKVAMMSVDTDGDGIPDWWEDQNGLNRHYTSDGMADPDGDGLSNLEEFRRATDPHESNVTAMVKTTSLILPPGAQAGLSILIVDQDTTPEELGLVVLHETDGITWYRDGIEWPPTQYFTYADVLAGRMTLRADSDFSGGPVTMGLHDPLEAIPDTSFVLQMETFTPRELAPAIWLHAGKLPANGPIAEWADASEFNRDAYQPFTLAEPLGLAGDRLDFASEQFMYVDDRGLELSDFTAFLAFHIDSLWVEDQALFSSPDFQLRVGGDASGYLPRSLRLTQEGRVLNGPPMAPGQNQQIIVGSKHDHSFLIDADHQYYISEPGAVSPLSTFTTLGGLQRLSDAKAQEFFQGGMQEFILFDRELNAEDRSLLEHYQLARWKGWLLWDHRDATLPLAIQGAADRSNLVRGGWGNDTLRGGPLADILVGGPGTDYCEGDAGPDRFQLFASSGNDVLVDFSPTEGDVIDLTSIFADHTGTPGQYIHLHAVVTRGEGNIPIVDTLMELDHDGYGGIPDQTITLKGVSLGDSDLPRLVGEGSICLGGPTYATSVILAASQASLSEMGDPLDITVTRSGNLDAAVELSLSFTGSAELDEDYAVEGTDGNGVIRTVDFVRGQAELVLRIVPIADAEMESESIVIQVLNAAAITDGYGLPLVLTLQDASFLTVETLRHLQVGREDSGQILIKRFGPLDEDLPVELNLGGNLVRDVDYEIVPDTITIPAGAANQVVEIKPIAPRQTTSDLEEVRVALDDGIGSYGVGDPKETSVLVLTGSDRLSFADWKIQNAGAENDLLAYVAGDTLDPDAGKVRILRNQEFIELRFATRAGLTDVALAVVFSSDLMTWQNATDHFTLQMTWLPDGRVQRVYRSKTPVLDRQRYFRISTRSL